MWLARHRWYDPELGRWVSRDPIGYGGGDPNLYGYVGGTVTAMVDPLGLKRTIDLVQGPTCLPSGTRGKADRVVIHVYEEAGWWDRARGALGREYVKTIDVGALDPDMSEAELDVRLAVLLGNEIALDSVKQALKDSYGPQALAMAAVGRGCTSWNGAKASHWRRFGPNGAAPTRLALVRVSRTGEIVLIQLTKELHHINGRKIPNPHADENLIEHSHTNTGLLILVVIQDTISSDGPSDRRRCSSCVPTDSTEAC